MFGWEFYDRLCMRNCFTAIAIPDFSAVALCSLHMILALNIHEICHILRVIYMGERCKVFFHIDAFEVYTCHGYGVTPLKRVFDE